MDEKTADEKIDQILAILTADKVADASGKVQTQANRLTGVIKSFRMNTAVVSATIVGAIQESGLPISEDGKTWITLAVMGYTALIIYSDTHKRIG